MAGQLKQVQRLIDIMSRLRDPDKGCPWDLEQDLKSLIPYTIEESYELAEAIEQEETTAIIKELGDLLFHVIFYAQLGREKQLFDLDKIAQAVSDKMIFRHPHVFAGHKYNSREDFDKDWTNKKQQEKASDNNKSKSHSLMDDVSTSLPAMIRSVKLQKQASYIGFDWDNITDVISKLKEEITELEQELQNKENIDRIKDEMGDILFTCVNLSRHLKLEPETTLRHANKKFSDRFKAMEEQFQYDHREMRKINIDTLEKKWKKIKQVD